jgi:hypothetical protein
MHDMTIRPAVRITSARMLIASFVAIGCGGGDDASSRNSAQAVPVERNTGMAGQGGALAGREATVGPMPGLGTMMLMAGNGAAAAGNAAGAGGAGAPALAGVSGSGGQAGAPLAGGPPQIGAAGSAGAATSGSAGAAGNAGAAGSGGPSNGMDPTTVCMGGKVGRDSDAVMTSSLGGGRNLATVMYLAKAPTKILSFKTILTVPKTPAQRQTLFIWPGLQHSGGSDPGRIGNGVLQPVLTWGPSCNPKAPSDTYASWWISAMYVNISSSAAGPGGCAGGDSIQTPIGDRLYIDFTANGNAWTQTVTDLNTMKKVDFTIDLKGQDQNWAIWDIEVPSSARPAEDTIFEKSVLTFSDPVTSCQPTNAAEVDYFAAPVLSADGKNCCYDKIILKQMRN